MAGAAGGVEPRAGRACQCAGAADGDGGAVPGPALRGRLPGEGAGWRWALLGSGWRRGQRPWKQPRQGGGHRVRSSPVPPALLCRGCSRFGKMGPGPLNPGAE